MRQHFYNFAHRVLPHDVHHEASLWSIISSDRAHSYLQMRWDAAGEGVERFPATKLMWFAPVQVGGATVRVVHLPPPEDAGEAYYAAVVRAADGALRYFVAERGVSGDAFMAEWRPDMRIRGGDLKQVDLEAASRFRGSSESQPWELSTSSIGGMPYLASFLQNISEELGGAVAAGPLPAGAAIPAGGRIPAGAAGPMISRSSAGLGPGGMSMPGGITPGGMVTRAAMGRPGVVTAAAILWIVFGGIGLLGQLSSLRFGFRPQSLVSLAIAAAFIVAGIQTLSGKAKDTLGNGIGAIVIGVLNLGFLLWVLSQVSAFMATGVVLLGAPFALGLIIGGILALVGRQRYREWRGTAS